MPSVRLGCSGDALATTLWSAITYCPLRGFGDSLSNIKDYCLIAICFPSTLGN
jgi:hypothetical protein